MLTLRIIRNAVEAFSFIDDISIKTRKREYVEARYVYFKLCKDLTSSTLSKIGSSLNMDHASVLHGVKMFDDLIGQEKFSQARTYKRCIDGFTLTTNEKTIKDILTLHELKEHYKLKYLKHLEKSHLVINNLRAKIDKVTGNRFIARCADLTEDEIAELEFKFDNFFRVKEHLRRKEENIKID